MSIRILSVILSAILPFTFGGCLHANLHNILDPTTPTGALFLILNWPSYSVPGLTVTTSEIPAVVGECQVNSTYGMVLDSQPAADVRVRVDFDPLHIMVNGVVVSPFELLFTPQNWNQPQQLVFGSPDDTIADEPTVVSVIDLTVLSDDSDYAALTLESISLTVFDNDVDFQINTHTDSYQEYPAISSNSIGNTVVVWRSDGQDGSGYGIFGQRFDSSGNPLGPEFQINSYTVLGQYDPAVAMDSAGNFVVVWMSNGQDGSGYGIFGQRFDSNGNPLGSEFQINTYTVGNQDIPVVAMITTGNFVVAWTSTGQDGSGFGIFGQRFDSTGNPLGPEFRINTYTANDQWLPAVAMNSAGNFAVVWQSMSQDGSGNGVFGRRFTATGSAACTGM